MKSLRQKVIYEIEELHCLALDAECFHNLELFETYMQQIDDYKKLCRAYYNEKQSEKEVD